MGSCLRRVYIRNLRVLSGLLNCPLKYVHIIPIAMTRYYTFQEDTEAVAGRDYRRDSQGDTRAHRRLVRLQYTSYYMYIHGVDYSLLDNAARNVPYHSKQKRKYQQQYEKLN